LEEALDLSYDRVLNDMNECYKLHNRFKFNFVGGWILSKLHHQPVHIYIYIIYEMMTAFGKVESNRPSPILNIDKYIC
jgi:hypothetical protein